VQSDSDLRRAEIARPIAGTQSKGKIGAIRVRLLGQNLGYVHRAGRPAENNRRNQADRPPSAGLTESCIKMIAGELDSMMASFLRSFARQQRELGFKEGQLDLAMNLILQQAMSRAGHGRRHST
jgi:hypothetical protein